MQAQCPRLERLVLDYDIHKKWNTSDSVFIENLEAARYLNHLEIKPRIGSECGWSSKVLGGVARHPNITTLKLPSIADEWWNDLERLPRQKLFQKVKTFSAELTDTGMQMLSRYIREQVTSLNVSLLPYSTRAVGIAARMPLLTTLVPNFSPDCVMKAEDLMMLGDDCKHLRYLYVGREDCCYTNYPRGKDITDTTIEYIAARLPKLIVFQFYIQDSTLTEESLISLGAHCKSLEIVYLTAKVSFNELVRKTQPNHFPALGLVSLTQVGSLPPCDDPRTTASLFSERAPALSVFNFDESGYMDWELLGEIFKQIE